MGIISSYLQKNKVICMKKSIGIDLGTTNSAAAIKKVAVEVLKNAEGEYITPSCVTVRKRLLRKPEYIVGRHALEWLHQEPENTITAVKRLIGKNYYDREVQDLQAEHGFRYALAPHSRGTANSLAILVAGIELTPEEVSAKILEKIKADAEQVIGDAVDTAVITVPAYFNDKQKHATRTAAALAGLKVNRLLPEPTAAAISFGVDQIQGEEACNVLVFDFGGGTLDLSLLTMSGGQIIEMGKGGDMWLGGEDIDRLILNHVLYESARQEGVEDIQALIDKQEISRKNRLLAELKTAAEKAKIALSEQLETCIEIFGLLLDSDGDALDIEVDLSRDQFEDMMAPVVENMLKLVRTLLAEVHCPPEALDRVLLVGGSSHIPCVIKALQKEFGEEKVLLHDRPMLAIAEGAAILSHRLAHVLECPQCGQEAAQKDSHCPHCGFDLEAYTLDHGIFDIVHAAAHDYFIRLENDQRFLLVEKNTPLPCSNTEYFKLTAADQELVHLKFYNIVNGKEESIGDLWLGIEHQHYEEEGKDMPHVAVTLDIDENNLVAAKAVLVDQPEIAVSGTLSRGKADEKLLLQVEQLLNEAESKGCTTYTVVDLVHRVRSILHSIQQLVDPNTGEVNENLFKSIEQKVQKTVKISEEDEAPLSRIYYAEGMLESYGMFIPPARQEQLLKKIAKVREVDENGSYEETMKALEELTNLLDHREFSLAHLFNQIENASEICYESNPALAKKFISYIEEFIRGAKQGELPQEEDFLAIMREVNEVLDEHAHCPQKIHKDLRK
jgi:molecular chaperone DnaK